MSEIIVHRDTDTTIMLVDRENPSRWVRTDTLVNVGDYQ